MTIPPTAMMGDMTIMRMLIIVNICTCVMSLVVRVMRDGVPILSNSFREKRSTRVKTLRRRSLPKPMPIRADSHAAAMEQSTPPSATSSICPPTRRMYAVSPLTIPVSTMSDIRVGRDSSEMACAATRASTIAMGKANGFRLRKSFIMSCSSFRRTAGGRGMRAGISARPSSPVARDRRPAAAASGSAPRRSPSPGSGLSLSG